MIPAEGFSSIMVTSVASASPVMIESASRTTM
jgi:hypothetical protein